MDILPINCINSMHRQKWIYVIETIVVSDITKLHCSLSPSPFVFGSTSYVQTSLWLLISFPFSIFKVMYHFNNLTIFLQLTQPFHFSLSHDMGKMWRLMINTFYYTLHITTKLYSLWNTETVHINTYWSPSLCLPFDPLLPWNLGHMHCDLRRTLGHKWWEWSTINTLP